MAPKFSPINKMTAIQTQTVSESIRKLAEKHPQGITPEIVLREASKKSSPLHDHFDWDDTVAAQRWRMEQAAGLIRKIRVTYDTPEGKTITVRAYVNVRDAEEGEEIDESSRGFYVAMGTAVSVESYRDQMLSACKRDAEAFERKYASLSEAAGVIKAIRRLK